MGENITKTLQEYETALEMCSTQYNTILQRIKELETNPDIMEYKKLQSGLSNLSKEYDRLSYEYKQIFQLACQHSLWYFIKDDSDRLEGRQRWVCKCVRCEMIKIGKSNDFKDKLIIESGNMGFGEQCLSSYDDVRKEYLQLESSTENKEDINKIMIKKYNNQRKR